MIEVSTRLGSLPFVVLRRQRHPPHPAIRPHPRAPAWPQETRIAFGWLRWNRRSGAIAR